VVALPSLVVSVLYGLLIGLVSLPLFGFGLRITRRVAMGNDLPLPDWADLGDLVRDGLKAWIVFTIWWLPANLADFVAGPGAGAAEGGGIALRGLGALLQLGIVVIGPAAETRLAVTGTVAAGLDARAAFGTVARNTGGYLVLALVTVVISGTFVVLGVGIVRLAWGGQLPGLREAIWSGTTLTILLFGSYTQFVFAHLAGQAYRRATPNPLPPHGGDAPSPLASSAS
jgi:hypothetical protein